MIRQQCSESISTLEFKKCVRLGDDWGTLHLHHIYAYFRNYMYTVVLVRYSIYRNVEYLPTFDIDTPWYLDTSIMIREKETTT